MLISEMLKTGPYALDKEEKSRLFSEELTKLTAFHRANCPAYASFLDACGCRGEQQLTEENQSFLPVSVFKEFNLRSVPEEDIFKTITSSGTTGQKVSRIHLDAQTARNQTMVLAHIMGDFLGSKRIPMIILDTRAVLKNRAMFSARGAGILGFSIFASKSIYALDENMQPDIEGLRQFLSEHKGEPIFLFGFTFMVWKHFIRVLEEKNIRLDIPNGVLVHGGGWKKLASEAVSPTEFRQRIKAACGFDRVYSYYGMAEQTGSIYMECEYGHLHASKWSDILIRRPADYSLCGFGEKGIVEVLSLLPRSYPGHALLTEDMGTVLGEDDCPCGRLGKYFSIEGRIPKAEVRGCSDTYEG